MILKSVEGISFVGFTNLLGIAPYRRLAPGSAWMRVILANRIIGMASIVAAFLLLLIGAVDLSITPTVQWILLLYPLALLVCLYGEARLRGYTLRRQAGRIVAAMSRHRSELSLLALVTMAGFVLRLWMVFQYPLSHGLETDEIDMADSAWNLVHGTSAWPLYQHATGSVSLFQPIGLSFLLFGTGMFSFRLPFILAGTASIPAFYLLARQFVLPPAALCATMLLSLAFWPTIMGLLAFGWMYGAVFQALGLSLMIIGVRHACLGAAAGGGAVLALCLYSYGVHRFMPIPAFVCLGALLLGGAHPAGRRWAMLPAIALGFAAAAAPWVSSVAHNAELLNGNTPVVTHDFQQAFHQHPLAALFDLLQPAGRLIMTVLAAPRTFGYQSVAVPSGGLLDGVTACLVLLGAILALPRFRRPENLFILSSIVLSLGIAAAIQPYWIDTYRLNTAVPAIFLVVALLLDRMYRALVHDDRSRLWAVAGLLALNVCSGSLNVYTIRSRLADCQSLTSGYELLSSPSVQGLLLADKINEMGSAHAAFVVSASFQQWLWLWLYRVPSPREYTPTGGDSRNPATWRVLFDPTPNAPLNGARFWPPRPGKGQTDITYFMPDGNAAAAFLPLVRARYPRGRIGDLQTAVCPSFKVITDTLTAEQL